MTDSWQRIRSDTNADSGARNSDFSRLGAGISGKRPRLLRCDGAIRRDLGFGEFPVMRQPRREFQISAESRDQLELTKSQ
jgi:hypothetical protein